MRSLNKRALSAGPGGIKCDCCRLPGCSKRDMLRMANRKFRRDMAREMRAEVAECR